MNVDAETILVIAAPDDALATAFAEHTNAAGFCAKQLDIATAAETFSTYISESGARVTPDTPILYRAHNVLPQGCDFDTEFLHWEALAAVWSAASLSSQAVVNRPSVWAANGKVGNSPYINERRAGLKSRREIYASDVALLAEDDATRESTGLWVSATAANRSYPLTGAPADAGPIRARPAFDDPGYEQVVVVDNAGWRASEAVSPHLGLELRSVAACKTLGLAFAVVLWQVDRRGEHASVAHIDPFPNFAQVAGHWDEVASALRKALLS